MPAISKACRPPTSDKRFKYFFAKLCLHGFASYLRRIHSNIVPINCENLKQIHAGKASKEIHLCVLLFDVGGPMMSQMPMSSAMVEGFEFSGFKLSYFMYFITWQSFKLTEK